MRICENFHNTEIQKFAKNSWKFPIIFEKIFWQEAGNMIAIILPVLRENYQFFALASEWIEIILKENLVYTGEIYDLDSFNIYE